MNMDTKKIEGFGKKVETAGKKMMKIGFSILFLLAGFFTLLFNVVVGIILILIAVVLIGSAFRKKAEAEVESPLDIPANQKSASEKAKIFKRWGEMTKKEKIATGVVLGIFLIMFILIFSGGEKKPKPAYKKVSYEVVNIQPIPNGGKTQIIIISPEFQNESDLLLVCDKIENETKYDRNAFAYGFKDEKSATLHQKDPLLLTEEELNYRDNNMILVFTKNANTGMHECRIYVNGIKGSEKTKTY
jgi:hypothetical protein